MSNSERLTIYVSQSVKSELEKKAGDLGLTVSSYLRHKVIEMIKEGN